MKVPEGTEQLRQTFRQQKRVQGDSALERFQAAARAVDSAAAEAGTPATKKPGVTRVEIEQPWRVSDMLWTGGLGALGILGQGVTVLFLTIFLLYEDDSFKRKLVAQMESQDNKRITVRILNDIASQIQRFIWVQALTSVAVAVATWLALWWIGVAEPMVWGILHDKDAVGPVAKLQALWNALPAPKAANSGQLAIKTSSAAPYIFPTHLTTQYVGYLPTREAYARGGHEANAEVTYWAKLAPGSLEAVVERAIALVRELFA